MTHAAGFSGQRPGFRAIAAAALGGVMVLASLAPATVRADQPMLHLADADGTTRCAVERAAGQYARELMVRVVEATGLLDAFLAATSGTPGSDAAANASLSQLGLLSADGGYATDFGRSVRATYDARGQMGSGGVGSLTIGGSSYQDTSSASSTSDFRIDTSALTSGELAIRVTPQAASGGACQVSFDPVIRASIAGAGLQWIGRGAGEGRIATLYLHDVPAGAAIDVSVTDAVGAPGSYSLEVMEVPVDMPAVDETTPAIGAGSGPMAWLPLDMNGADGMGGVVATLLVTVGEGADTQFRVTGLGEAQPGVRVYAAGDDGQPQGEPVMRSPFVPVMDRTVDLGHLLGPGTYVVTVEDLQRRPGTMLVAYTSSGAGPAMRVSGTIELGGESAQVLGSDLALTITEAGWYAFSTWSYDEVDPVMSLLDSDGYVLVQNDDAAFSLHPLIIAELQPGDYSLAIDGFDGAQGDVTLGAWKIDLQSLAIGTVGLEQQVANDLSQPPFSVYRIDAVSRELLDIDVAPLGDDFDSTLAIYDPYDMSVWNADDDGGAGYGSRVIDSFDGATLLVVVSAYDASRGGAFAISVVDHAKMENLVESARPLVPGAAPLAGSLAVDGDIAWFRVQAAPAGSHTVTARSTDMPYLNVDFFVREGDGYTWLDSLEGYDGETALGFDSDGAMDIFVLVRNPSGEGVGPFEIGVD